MTKVSTYAAHLGLRSDPFAACSYLSCGYKRAAKSRAAMALHTWRSIHGDAIHTNFCDENSLRWKTNVDVAYNHPTASVVGKTPAGHVHLLAFQDRSALLLLRDPTGYKSAPVTVIPWVFSLRKRPENQKPRLEIRNPNNSRKDALPAILRDNHPITYIQKSTIVSQDALVLDTLEALHSDLRIISKSLGSVLKAERRLDYLPHQSWNASQQGTAFEIAQDMCDWMTMMLKPTTPKLGHMILTLHARLPGDQNGPPLMMWDMVEQNGVMRRYKHLESFQDLENFLKSPLLRPLLPLLGSPKGLAFKINRSRHSIEPAIIARGSGDAEVSHHRKLELFAKFGTSLP